MQKPGERNVTSEVCAQSAALKSAGEDKTDTFDGLMQYCYKFTPKNCIDNSASGGAQILKFKERFPPEIEYSLLIHDSFQVGAYRGHTKVATDKWVYPI